MQKYRRLLSYTRPHRRFFGCIVVLTIAASALAALQPFALAATPGNMLLLIVVGGLVLFALNSVLELGLTWAWTLGGQRMVYSLAEDLFARLQRRSLLFHRRNSV